MLSPQKGPLCLHAVTPHSHLCLQAVTDVLFLSLCIWVFWIFPINDVIQHVTSCIRLLSLSHVSGTMLQHVLVFYSFYCPQYSIVWTDHILFIHSPANGHLGCFHFWARLNNASMNVHQQVLVQTGVFISLEQIPRSRTAGWYKISLFNIFKNFHTVFQNGCTILHS